MNHPIDLKWTKTDKLECGEMTITPARNKHNPKGTGYWIRFAGSQLAWFATIAEAKEGARNLVDSLLVERYVTNAPGAAR